MPRRAFPLGMLALLLRALSVFSPAQQVSTHEGREIFSTRCATCHGLDGQGGERGPNIASRREVQRLSDAALLKIVRGGIPAVGMPAFGTLGSVKLEAVVQHLRRLQGRNTASVPGDPGRGRALFSGKAACAQCHAVNGEGGFLGSDLSNYADTQSIENIRTAITDPNKNLDPRHQTVVVTSANGTTNAGIARNEDNFSLQLQTEDGAFHSFTKSDLRGIERRPRSLMPADYSTRLNTAEIDDIVSYLVKVSRTHPGRKPAKNDD